MLFSIIVGKKFKRLDSFYFYSLFFLESSLLSFLFQHKGKAMFGNGNNQAMQFIAQGYSDSIKTYNDQSAGNLMKNLNGLTNSYFQNEASIENTEGQRLQNHYNRENMQTALDQQKEILKHQQLGNEYDSRTMNDRVRNVTYLTNINQDEAKHSRETLGYDYNTGKATGRGRIGATNTESGIVIDTGKTKTNMLNAQQIEAKKKADLGSEITDNQHDNFRGIPIYYDKQGNAYENLVYKDGKLIGYGKKLDDNRRQQIEAHNNKVKQNKLDVGAEFMARNNASKEANIYSELNSKNQSQIADNQFKSVQELQDVMKKTGTSNLRLAEIVNQAMQVGSQNVTIGDKEFDTMTLYNTLQGYPLGASNMNVNGNTNIQNVTMPKPNLLVDARDSALAINEISQMPSEQQDAFFTSSQGREAVNNLVNTNPTTRNKVVEYQGNIESLGYVTNDIQALQGHRLKAGIGKFTKLLGLNDEAEAMNIMAKYANSNSIIETLKGLKGAASDRDMALVAKNAFSLWQSDTANAQVMLNLNRSQLVQYNKLISTIGGNPKALLALPQGERMYREYMECNALVNGLSGAYNNK